MVRKKFFKFRLTQKQKRRLIVFIAAGACVWGTLVFVKHYTPHPAPKPAPRKVLQPIPSPRRAPTPSPIPSVRPSIPPVMPLVRARNAHPKITFVIDDIGAHNKLTAQLASLGSKVTYAILPLLPYSRYFGHLSERTHAEVILHLPLDTIQDKIPGPGLIVNTMSDEDILEMLSRDLDSVPNHVGANNHMGSRGTTDHRVMTLILSELKRRDLFFLDSYTTLESVVREVGREVGLPVLTRGVFLDNVDARPQILGQIHRVEAIARAKGTSIAIGHYRKNTLEILADEIPRLENEGFEIITLKEMLKIQPD